LKKVLLISFSFKVVLPGSILVVSGFENGYLSKITGAEYRKAVLNSIPPGFLVLRLTFGDF